MAQTFFSDAQLADLRATAESAFDKFCDILGKSSNHSNNAGGRSAAMADRAKAATNIACHVRPSRRIPIETTVAGVTVSKKRFEIILPWNQPISDTQQIAVQGGAVYDVLGSDYGRSYATETIVDVILAD